MFWSLYNIKEFTKYLIGKKKYLSILSSSM
nr:MAG TPA: hypothetical protein [Caudoviricetes sp.]